jgi:putative transposase
MLQAYRFALDPVPVPAQARVLASHCGAARRAFNEGLAHVKRCLNQRGAERSYGVREGLLTEVPWTLPALRRWWNASKQVLAPWWAQNSKEAYNSGLDALARGLQQYSAARSGRQRRAGAEPGAGRRRTRRAAPPARLQNHLVRLGPSCGGPVVSQLKNLLGLRRGESQARPGRQDLPV